MKERTEIANLEADLKADLKAAHEEIGRLNARLEQSIVLSCKSVELLCKIGDTVYWVGGFTKKSVRDGVVEGAWINAEGIFIEVDTEEGKRSFIARRLFLEKSAAEARLKELEGKE